MGSIGGLILRLLEDFFEYCFGTTWDYIRPTGDWFGTTKGYLMFFQGQLWFLSWKFVFFYFFISQAAKLRGELSVQRGELTRWWQTSSKHCNAHNTRPCAEMGLWDLNAVWAGTFLGFFNISLDLLKLWYKWESSILNPQFRSVPLFLASNQSPERKRMKINHTISI